jgi:uncharacterized protein (TIGR03437 family)
MLPKLTASISLTILASFSLQAQPPTLASVNPVVHGVTFGTDISGGTWLSIRGTNFTSVTRTWSGADFNGNFLPESLDGIRVRVNSRPAFVYFISPNQINILADDDPTTGPVTLEVITPNGTLTTTVTLRRYAPGFFAFDPLNRMYAIAQAPDGSFYGPPGLFGSALTTMPMPRGGRFIAYGNGFGETDPATPVRQIVAGPAPFRNRPQLSLGGRPVTQEFAGRVGSGLDQFNGIVPDVPAGDQLFSAEVEGTRTPNNLFLCVAANNPVNLAVASNSLSFSETAGQLTSKAQMVQVTSTGEPVGFTTAIEPSTAVWLTATRNGNTDGPIEVAVNTSGLPAGNYTATVVVRSCVAGNPPQRISVALSLAPASGGGPNLTVAPASLAFTAAQGSQAPAQTLALQGSASSFNASAAAATGGNWLSVTPVSGSAPATLNVSVNTNRTRGGLL